MRVTLHGRLGTGVAIKDVALALIARIGIGGAAGHAVEYAGETVAALSMAERMTLCNMSIEAGSRVGMVAPDDTTFAYVDGRKMAPKGVLWERALAFWRGLPGDTDAAFDRIVALDVAAVAPHVTWGTTPEEAIPVTGRVPDPEAEADPARRARMRRSLAYMALVPGTALQDVAIDRVFIGSCTNGRLEDLRAAAAVAAGRRVARARHGCARLRRGAGGRGGRGAGPHFSRRGLRVAIGRI